MNTCIRPIGSQGLQGANTGFLAALLQDEERRRRKSSDDLEIPSQDQVRRHSTGRVQLDPKAASQLGARPFRLNCFKTFVQFRVQRARPPAPRILQGSASSGDG